MHLVAGVGKLRMPLEGEPLSDEQVGILRAWIDQGAQWLEDVAVSASHPSDAGAGHWSFQQIRDPCPPGAEQCMAAQADRCLHPVPAGAGGLGAIAASRSGRP